MEDWNGVKARGTGPRWHLLVAVVVVLIMAMLVFNLVLRHGHEHDPSPDAGDPRASELAHLKMLGRALKLHADEHEGKFPAAIADIQWRQNMPGMDWAGLPAAVSRFHNPETGKVSDWLYYPGHTENDPPETILVAAPVALGKARDRRMVVRVDSVSEIIEEGEFQRQVAGLGNGQDAP